ncbi:PPC domain-containing DNA-binding protein [Chitinophaga pinensis]|uniref:PPC domain-containing protein n=1 Tax=Chitinophaga pinensis (strain ATCC 43595 / DSM 2588 / LMG 13176 / NBRC 15968 / NCIMB 11800 / UQM 2034) TaxID=485918 RepID=A0A979GY47_CHIPD|nr:PPC domain-containing DNA-binding protein [Chitinophaga pinensis]ACU61640.1 protein of unknown function DUF296 [Chitinophaga pinensis DSM 2588]
MKKIAYFLIQLLSVGLAANAQSPYVKVPAGYLMVLQQGDDLFAQLEAFMLKENIPAANFTGMGFVNAKFGFFNQQTKQYDPRSFDNVELASMQGSIAWQQDTVSIHAHGVVTDNTFQAYGGHMLGATVSTGSVEIMITVHDKRFKRVKDEKIGANVLQLRE